MVSIIQNKQIKSLINPGSNSENMVAKSTLVFFLTLFVANFFVALVKLFYYLVPVNDVISFFAEEPPAWVVIKPEIHAFGVHYFGDYLLSNHWSNLSNPWSSEGPVNYPPFALTVFDFFDFFSYRHGLVLYLVSMLVFLLLPFIFYVKNQKDYVSFVILLTVGFLNAPTLISLDRGNISGFVSGFIFLAGYFFLRQKYNISSIFIAIASAIKIYPAFLFLLYVLRGKRTSILIGFISVIFFTFGLFLLYPGNLISNISNFISDLTFFTNPTQESFNCRNLSYIAGLSAWLKLFGFVNISMTLFNNLIFVQIFILCISILLLLSLKIEIWIKIFISMSMTVTVPAIQYGYAMNWASAALGIILISSGKDSARYSGSQILEKTNEFSKNMGNMKLPIALFLTLLLVPWPYALPSRVTECPTSILPLIFSFFYTLIICKLIFNLFLSNRLKNKNYRVD